MADALAMFRTASVRVILEGNSRRASFVAISKFGMSKMKRSCKETLKCCISNHSVDRAAFAWADRYIIVKRKRHPQTIETGPEIRSAGGNMHRDLLHSPSSSCAPNAARQAIMRDEITRET